MLWTDSIFITQADLQSLDPDVNDTATAEGIVVDGVNGIAQRSLEACGMFVLSKMQAFAGFLAGSELSANHLNAVFNVGLPAIQRSTILLNNIVVDSPNPRTWTPLKRWAAYYTLAEFYRAASNRQTQTDRYERKCTEYVKKARWTEWPIFAENGLPVVYKPMSVPEAYFENNPGTFSISTATGPGTLVNTYQVQITYVDSTVYGGAAAPKNGESGFSAPKTVAVTTGKVISLDISGLNTPNGMAAPADYASAIITPLNADGWNVYVGLVGGPMYLQNGAPIAITTKQFVLTGDPVLTGRSSFGTGQYPDQKLSIPELRVRG